MKIELTSDQLDEIAEKKIQALEKEVRSLKAKLNNRDKKISQLQGGIDLTKDTRKEIRSAAGELVALLQDADWDDYDRYYV